MSVLDHNTTDSLEKALSLASDVYIIEPESFLDNGSICISGEKIKLPSHEATELMEELVNAITILANEIKILKDEDSPGNINFLELEDTPDEDIF